MATGIPLLLNAGSIAGTVSVGLLSNDKLPVTFSGINAPWGIYFAGTNRVALTADSVVSFGYKKEYKISDYPLELGTFVNYNKVDLPFAATVRMTMGGSQLKRAEFLNTLVELGTSTDLFDIVTPEYVYTRSNIVGYDYMRTATNGAGLIIADIRLMEIRTTAQSTFSNTQSSTDQSSVDGGQIAPSAPINNPPESVARAASDVDN
jgi:hypothetical protein